MITYDKYYQTPRVWLVGHDEVREKKTLFFGLANGWIIGRKAFTPFADLGRYPGRSRQQDCYNGAFHPRGEVASGFGPSLQTLERHEEGD